MAHRPAEGATNADQIWSAFSRRLFDQNLFAVKLGLDNIRRALELEGHPEARSPAIIVGGTNGKGGTSAYLAGILQSHGLQVGLYTSPHLIEVRERFRVGGVPVSREQALEIGHRVLSRYGDEGADPQLTFFELTTLMATLLFAEHAVDVAIYEVGLGGRLDAVNAIEPALTLLTTIDLDHQAYLGDSVAEIAAEKAGLVRSDVAVLMGAQAHEEAVDVVRRAARRAGAPLREVAPEGEEEVDLPEGGRARRQNAALAVAAAREYLGEAFDVARAAEGLDRTRWPGRFDSRTLRLDGEEVPCLLDAAHNPAGGAALRDYLRDARVPVRAVVCGGMADKDLEATFGLLDELRAPVWGARIDSPRAADEERLTQALSSRRLQDVLPVGAALREAAAAPGEGVVLIFGSVYLLGEAMAEGGVEAEELVTWQA